MMCLLYFSSNSRKESDSNLKYRSEQLSFFSYSLLRQPPGTATATATVMPTIGLLHATANSTFRISKHIASLDDIVFCMLYSSAF